MLERAGLRGRSNRGSSRDVGRASRTCERRRATADRISLWTATSESCRRWHRARTMHAPSHRRSLLFRTCGIEKVDDERFLRAAWLVAREELGSKRGRERSRGHAIAGERSRTNARPSVEGRRKSRGVSPRSPARIARLGNRCLPERLRGSAALLRVSSIRGADFPIALPTAWSRRFSSVAGKAGIEHRSGHERRREIPPGWHRSSRLALLCRLANGPLVHLGAIEFATADTRDTWSFGVTARGDRASLRSSAGTGVGPGRTRGFGPRPGGPRSATRWGVVGGDGGARPPTFGAAAWDTRNPFALGARAPTPRSQGHPRGESAIASPKETETERLGELPTCHPSPHVPGAAERTRTSDPVLTKDVLYQLSYGSPRLTHSRTCHMPQASARDNLMADREETSRRQPRRSPAGERAREERERRLAAALRANLRRRKMRPRSPEDGRTAPEEDGASA